MRVVHGPLFVSVEPSAICQLHCPECPVGLAYRNPTKGGRVETPFMSREVWERVLTEVAACAHTIQFYFQGEPLLHPRLTEMVKEAHEVGLYTIVSTNAQALSKEQAEALMETGLSKVIVSMDGLTEESYGAYRVGGSLAQCKQALRWLREAKERQHGCTTIELQCLRLRTNEHEWEAFHREYKALGADRLVLKTAQLHDYTMGHPLMPTEARYSRYVRGEDGFYHRKKLRRGCWRVWTGCVVTTMGNVLPCCYDKAHAHAYGNIMSTPLRELFGSVKANLFRRVAMVQQPDICQECWK